MSCDGCVQDVSKSLHNLPGVTKVEGNLKDQLVSVEGSGEWSSHYLVVNSTISLSSQLHRQPLWRLFKQRGEMPFCVDQESLIVSEPPLTLMRE